MNGRISYGQTMIPARHFAGRAPVTPPSSDSESESKSESDAELVRPTPVPRRRRFVARVVGEPESDKQTSADAPKHVRQAKGFVPLKELQTSVKPQIQTPVPVVQPQEQTLSQLSDQPPPAPPSSSSSSQSSESESEDSPSPPLQPPPPPAFKPVFIKPKPKEAPDTSRQESRELERKKEARQLVSAALKEEEASHRIERHVDLPDDTDFEHDRPREEALWRVREMRRVLREREGEKAWRNRGMVERVADAERETGRNGAKEAGQIRMETESGNSEREVPRRTIAGPFFAERDEDGRFREEIYNRELQEGRGELSGLRVGRDGGRSGRTKFTGLGKEDTAGEMVRELRRDRELAATLEAARRR